MTYYEKKAIQQRYNKTIELYVKLNIILFLTIFSFQWDSWSSRLICGGLSILGFGLLIQFTKLIFKRQQKIKDDILREYGETEILCDANQYFGFMRTSKVMLGILCVVYEAIFIFVCALIYREWFESLFILIGLCFLHIVLFIPILYAVIKSSKNTIFFTPTHIIINYQSVLYYDKISKFQFIELLTGDQLLDINSGQTFIRVSFNKVHYPLICAHLPQKNEA